MIYCPNHLSPLIILYLSCLQMKILSPILKGIASELIPPLDGNIAVRSIENSLLYFNFDDTCGPLSPQQPHIDFLIPPFNVGGYYVRITALGGTYKILIWPGSHHIIQRLGDFHGGKYVSEFQKRMPGFAQRSTKEIDAAFNQEFYSALRNALSEIPPVLVSIPEGATIWMDGRLIHSGMSGDINDEGTDVLPCYRFHSYYVPSTDLGSSSVKVPSGVLGTYPLDMLHPNLMTEGFRTLFWDKSRPAAQAAASRCACLVIPGTNAFYTYLACIGPTIRAINTKSISSVFREREEYRQLILHDSHEDDEITSVR